MSQHVENPARRIRWSAAREAPLIWRSWEEGDYVIYCTASGDTHQINEVSAEVLRRLEHRELELSELARDVAKALGAEVDQAFETQVGRLVAYLDRIGLVEPAP